MIDEAKIWIEATLKSQRPDGSFGPINMRGDKPELWAQMTMLWCLQSYYEYSNDSRVLDLMTNYFNGSLIWLMKNFWKITGKTAAEEIIC